MTTPEFFNSTAGEIGSKNPNNPDASLFSILNQLERFRSPGGNFYLKICYPGATNGIDGGTCNEWSQSSNFFTQSSITGFLPKKLAFPKRGDGSEWQGLALNENTQSKAVIDDTPTSDDIAMAIGVTEKMDDGGIHGPFWDSGPQIITKVELYAHLRLEISEFLVNDEVDVKCKKHGQDFNIGYNVQDMNFQCGDK